LSAVRRARPLGALFAWGFTLLAARGVGAQPHDQAEVAIASARLDASALMEAVREPLQDLGLGVRASLLKEGDSIDPGAVPAGVRVRVWIDARGEDRVEVVVSVPDQGGTRSVTRSVARGESDPVLIDQIAYVVRATVASLLAEPPAPAPPPPPTPQPAPPVLAPAPALARESPPPTPPLMGERRSPLALDAMAFGSGRALGSAPLLGGGGGVDVAPWGRGRWRPAVWLSGALYAPLQAKADLVTLETSVVAARLMGDVSIAQVGIFLLDVGAGGGFDVARSVPIASSAPAVTLSDPSTQVDPMFSARVMGSFAIPHGPRIVVAFDLDVDVAPHLYETVDSTGAVNVVLDPWRVRPGMTIGLSIPFFEGTASR
jgi:hypothetical protein